MLAGPYATMLLADLGADVIKIEPPGGEISRQVSDSYFASINRNKQSVCLDLRSDEGRARLGELVAVVTDRQQPNRQVGHPASANWRNLARIASSSPAAVRSPTSRASPRSSRR